MGPVVLDCNYTDTHRAAVSVWRKISVQVQRTRKRTIDRDIKRLGVKRGLQPPESKSPKPRKSNKQVGNSLTIRIYGVGYKYEQRSKQMPYTTEKVGRTRTNIF